jgi:hypothetical protein
MTGTWGRRLFRTGAIVLILLGAVHSLSFFNPLVPQNDTERQLFSLADNYKFDLMGSPRSMSDLMRGFSISFMLAAFVVGAINLALWSDPNRTLKRVALVTTIWLAVMTAVSLRYFFVIPTTFLVFDLIIFLAAWLALPSTATS